MQGRKPDISKSNVFKLKAANKNQLEVDYGIAAIDLMPFGFSVDEENLWLEKAPELIKLGRLKSIYVEAFAEYIRVVIRLRKWRKELDNDSWVYAIEGRNGQQQKMHPLAGQVNEAWRQWRSLTAEFGLTPASDKGLLGGQSDLINDFADF